MVQMRLYKRIIKIGVSKIWQRALSKHETNVEKDKTKHSKVFDIKSENDHKQNYMTRTAIQIHKAMQIYSS